MRRGTGQEIGHRLSRWLRLRFFLILVMLGVVSLGAFSVFSSLVSGQDEGASLLTVSAHQRVLVERIATDSLRIIDTPAGPKREAIRENLRNTAQQLVAVQNSLDYSVAGPEAQKKAQAILYEDPYKLSRRILELDNAVAALVQQPDDMVVHGDEQVRRIDQLSRDGLSEGLDSLVATLAEGLRHRVVDLNRFALIGEPLFLALLILMAWKVFRPLLRQTGESVAQLAALEGYHRSVVDSLADGILVVDPNQRRVEALNPAALGIFHLTEAGGVGLPLDELIPATASNSVPQLRRWNRQEVEGRNSADQTFHLEVTVRETSVDGFDRLIVVVRDVTKQVEAEERVHTLNYALEQSAASVIITNTDGVIVYANPRACIISGYSREELVGNTPRLLQSGLTPQTVYGELWSTLRAGKEWHGEMLNRRKSGELYWESLVISPLRSSRGEITQFMAVMEDISNRKLMEDALVVAKQQAERASRAKSDFLASMSHELRTPLNAIIGYSEFIDTEPFGGLGHDKYREYLGHIQESGRHLLELINDMLDLSKVEAGKLVLEEEEVDLAHSIQGAIHLVMERASRSDVLLTADLAPDLPHIWADNLRLKQIMLNLLTNAIKFTPEGGTVTLGAGRERDGSLSLRVSDTGVGISPRDIPRVLEPFGQVNNPLVRREEGTGLGLPITKRLVELHGGSLEIASQVGEGTTVTVRLPAARLRGVSPAAQVPRAEGLA
ncbi:MAG TPA: PAS domain-containing sensor histidine kinase [Candidatus Sulfotelmatobacter sp.]|jgi:PAS domain S-box-containing protein|nr:PAS domain-containing sensor histidine kinase [Candidatus Sulfotelmatobacter sp.]